MITDYWTISIGHECSTNVLGLTTPTTSQPDFTIQTSGDGTGTSVAFSGHTADASISRTVATSSCPILCKMLIWDETNNIWEKYSVDVTPSYVANWSGSDCSWDLVVPASDGATYSPADEDPDIIYLRYAVWDANSDQGDDGLATIYDPFSITMNYACYDDSVIIAPADDIGTQIYIIDVDEGTVHQQVISPSVTHA